MEVTVEVLAKVAIEVLVVLLDWGVGNLIYYYIVVQVGSGFNIDTGAALYLTVAAEAAAEVITEITVEVLVEVASRLGYRSQI